MVRNKAQDHIRVPREAAHRAILNMISVSIEKAFNMVALSS
jgi:hypothetical protein